MPEIDVLRVIVAGRSAARMAVLPRENAVGKVRKTTCDGVCGKSEKKIEGW